MRNDQIFDKRFRNIDAEICGTRVVGCKKTSEMTENRNIYIIKYKGNLEKMLGEKEDEVEVILQEQ
jgi:hypothetical protein